MFNETYYEELSDEYIEFWGGDNYVLKRILIIIATHVSSALSFFGSVYILYDIFWKGRTNRKETLATSFHQLLVGLSLSDSISSFALFFTTWAMPADGIDAKFFVGSSGNATTCKVQGMLIVTGSIASNAFVVSIAIQSFLYTKYRLTSAKMKMLNRSFLIFAPMTALSFGILFFIDDAFVPLGIACFPGGVYPYFCRYSEKSHREQCVMREPKVPWSQTIFICYYSVSFMILTFLMASVIMEAKKRRRKSARWSFVHDGRHDKSSRKIVNRASLHIMASATIYLPLIVALTVPQPNSWLTGITLSTTYPLQGFLNALIYSRKYVVLLRYFKLKKIRLSEKFARTAAKCSRTNDTTLQDQKNDVPSHLKNVKSVALPHNLSLEKDGENDLSMNEADTIRQIEDAVFALKNGHVNAMRSI